MSPLEKAEAVNAMSATERTRVLNGIAKVEITSAFTTGATGGGRRLELLQLKGPYSPPPRAGEPPTQATMPSLPGGIDQFISARAKDEDESTAPSGSAGLVDAAQELEDRGKGHPVSPYMDI